MNYNSANAGIILFHEMRYFRMQDFFHCPSNSIMCGVEYSTQVHTMCHLDVPFLPSASPDLSPHPLKNDNYSQVILTLLKHVEKLMGAGKPLLPKVWSMELGNL